MDLNEPGNGLFMLISVFQLVFIVLLFVASETNAFNKEYLRNYLMNLFNFNPNYISMNSEVKNIII